MNRHTASPHGNQAWIAEHLAGLRGHVTQCWTRHLWLTAAQCLSVAHEKLSQRFATTVFFAAGSIVLLTQWPWQWP